MITVVQTSGGHSTTAGPASIVPTWSATVAGNTLILALGLALSGAPTVTPPAGWQLVTSSIQGAAVASYIYALVGNAGGITSQTFSLANVNGAGWQLWELAGAAPGPTPADPLWGALTASASSTTVGFPTPILRPRASGGTYDIAALAYLTSGGGYTDGSGTSGIGPPISPATQTSTNGATNVTLITLTQQLGPTPPRSVELGGTIGVAAASAGVTTALLAADSQTLTRDSYGVCTLGASPASIGGL